ncbi:hypothetical protein [Arthrospira platensis]|nr:hypothetical protein SPLC1_S206340 [Arthrospira platensis C1]
MADTGGGKRSPIYPDGDRDDRLYPHGARTSSINQSDGAMIKRQW